MHSPVSGSRAFKGTAEIAKGYCLSVEETNKAQLTAQTIKYLT
jgi:hypothetical protein